MLRLFGLAGLLIVVSAGIAAATDSPFFRGLTPVLGAAMALLYLWLQRGLPRRSGVMTLSGLRDTVEVFRDNRGIPHIFANNLHDLYLAQGYVTAQDRLWTMDLNRRASSGQLAELFGPGFLSMDKHFRTLGLRRAADISLRAYSSETRQCLEAYAAGVNARMAEGALPPEFGLLRYRPQPWTPVDSLAVGKYMAYDFSGNWPGKLFLARLVQAVGADKGAEQFERPPEMSLLASLEEMPLPDVSGLLEIAASTVNGTAEGTSWVVSGIKTRGGAPCLANSPEIQIRNPSLWYQTHLRGLDGIDVIGVAVPGVPGIMMGQNRAFAWGATHLGADVQDVYLEKVHPDRPDQFAFKEAWETAATIREEIRVRGKRQPVVHEIMVTRHGPIIARDERIALSLRWSALGATTEYETIFRINHAKSWPEFREALRFFDGPAQHFVFAGRDGTIAWRAAGTLPVRTGGDGQIPMPGWTGAHEWSGTVPFEAFPECVNPPEGFLVSGDQPLHIDGYPNLQASTKHLRRQAQHLAVRLSRATGLTPDTMKMLQLTSVNSEARSLLQLLLHSVEEGLRQGVLPETLTAREKKALLILSGWDGEEDPASAAPALWHQWYLFFLEGIYRPQMGLMLFDQFMACGTPWAVTDRLTRGVAEGGESAWLAREGEKGLGRIALRAFRRAVALLSARQGPHPERWRWGREFRVRFEHPLARAHRLVKPFLSLGPYSAGGSGTHACGPGYHSVRPFEARVAAVWRQVVDLGAPSESQDICAPGQSGHPMSQHCADQVSAWLKGEYQPRLYRHEAIRRFPRLVLKPFQPD